MWRSTSQKLYSSSSVKNSVMTDKIIIDSNEPEEIKQEIRKRADFKVQVRSLDQGDFLYPDRGVAIERKEGSDLAQSIQDRRVKEQTARMRAQHDHVYLIAEGELFNLPYSNLHNNSITGQLISLAVKKGVRIIPTNNKAGTGYAANRVFERHRDNEHQTQTEYLKRHDTGEVKDLPVAILMQIQGISEQKAKNLLNHISWHDLISRISRPGNKNEVLSETIQEVEGFGPKTAEKVIKAFQSNK